MGSEGSLPLIESQEFAGGDLHGTGDMENVHCAATQARRFHAQLAEGVHQIAALDFRKNIKSLTAAVFKMRDLRGGLGGGDFLPKHFQVQGVEQFRFLNLPDRQRQILRGNAGLYRFRARFANVEFEQGAGIKIKHDYQRPSRSAVTVASADRPAAGMAVAK